MFKDYFGKDNLHHAYLIEGKKEEITPELFIFLESIGVKTSGNLDFNHLIMDSMKAKDARNIKSQSLERPISDSKKVFVISVNSFLIDAQNTLLKMFEEPIDNTIFFVIVPDTAIILPTLLSRFNVIKPKDESNTGLRQAEEFLKMSLGDRIAFIKEVIVLSKDKDEDEEDLEIPIQIESDSNRSRAIKFLNTLELILHKKFISQDFDANNNVDFFYQILKAREYLSEPGSSAKSLMEGVALVVPKL